MRNNFKKRRPWPGVPGLASLADENFPWSSDKLLGVVARQVIVTPCMEFQLYDIIVSQARLAHFQHNQTTFYTQPATSNYSTTRQLSKGLLFKEVLTSEKITQIDFLIWLGTIKKSHNPLRGRGEVTKRLYKITRGGRDTPKDYIGLQGVGVNLVQP